jgi:hypothetical protein
LAGRSGRFAPATTSSWTSRRACSTQWVSDGELAKRKVNWQAPEERFTRGCYELAEEQTERPDKGYDWKILKGRGAAPKDPRIG